MTPTISFSASPPDILPIDPPGIFATFCNKVATLSPGWFRLIQGIALSAYGLKEILFDGPKSRLGAPPGDNSLLSRIKSACYDYFMRKKQEISSGQFHILHGALFVGTGIAGSLAALHQLDKINLAWTFPIFEGLEIGLFLWGSALALVHNVREYQKAATLVASSEKVENLKLSAVIGMISSLSYILWVASYLLGGAALMPLFLCLGLATGCLKILFDYFTASTGL